MDLAIQTLYRRLAGFDRAKSQRPTQIWVEQALFQEGLRPFVKEYKELFERPEFRYRLQKFFSHRAIKFILNPSHLPDRKDVGVPADVLMQVYLTGIKNNSALIEHTYRKLGQDRLEFYRKIQNAYEKVFLGLTFLLLFQTYQDAEDQIQDLQKDSYLENLDEIERGLNELDQMLQQQGFYN